MHPPFLVARQANWLRNCRAAATLFTSAASVSATPLVLTATVDQKTVCTCYF
ncbi:hypothetical protein [Pseudomonas sp. LB3P38]|uniref:hypothetical protein n=1 Tax=Pseudomonas lyxosi TaxID=3398358 RepID=UPI0039EE3211